ncbi:MAG: hypothetical protein K8W52_02960 [Deltaproteobacteria bacterium]|nr:hypothetical protein [Deltaproteobacteria bacterium]
MCVRSVGSLSCVLVASLALAACGDNHGDPDAGTGIDAAVIDAQVVDGGVDANPNMPPTIADTGLCLDAGCQQIAPDVHGYAPRWALWSDGAVKQRYIYLPPGATIDTSDMDHWKFPMGTKLWKVFTRDNIRVETRFYLKTGPADTDWYFVAYAWNEAQTEAVAAPSGQQNANGTTHDIPQRSDCRKCHDQVPGRVLGFSALQLDYDAPSTELDLKDLVSMNLLSAPPTAATGPYFPLPAATPTEIAALGYLHANCGHCHNPDSTVHQIVPQVLRLSTAPSALATLEATPTYMTTVNVAPTQSSVSAPAIVNAGDPDHSAMIIRFESTNPAIHMPAIATEVLDTTADATLRDWITHIP